MNRRDEYSTFLNGLNQAISAGGDAAFTTIFARGCLLLELDDDEAARLFDTSRPTVSRWRRGKVVPPSAKLVLRFLHDAVDARATKYARLEASHAARGAEAHP